MDKREISKNGLANLLLGAAHWLPGLVFPMVVAQCYSASALANLGIAFQVLAYVGFLGFGVQVALGRYVAFYQQPGDREQRRNISTAACRCLYGAGWLGIPVTLLFAWSVYRFFPEGSSEAAWLAVVLGVSAVFFLWSLPYSAVFFGERRNEVPALLTVVFRLLQMGLVVVAAGLRGPLLMLAGVFSAVAGLMWLAQRWVFYRWSRHPRIFTGQPGRNDYRRLWHYCMPLMLWQLGLLLITGTDVLLVGVLDYETTGAFVIAASWVAVYSGLASALTQPLIPVTAGALRERQHPAIRRWLWRMSGLFVAGGGVFVTLVMLGSPWLIEALYGVAYVSDGALLMGLMAVAAAIRGLGAPYASMVIGAGRQHEILWSPVVEGVTNVVASVVLGLHYGAVGIAVGSILGAVTGLLFHVLRNMRYTAPVTLLQNRA